MRVRSSTLFTLSAVLLGAMLSLGWPVETGRIASHPAPAAGYEDAVAAVTALRAEESDSLAEACRPTLLSHGRRTARAFVFLHGYANCPNQFLSLARQVFETGSNVLLLRLPRHGYANRMTEATSQLTASDLARIGDRAADIGIGLGEGVTIAGLSAGGVVAAWAAIERPEIDRAVLLAPFFGIRGVPEAASGLIIHVLTSLPDRQLWWDPIRKEDLPGSKLTYPRYSTHAVGECLRLGMAVRRAAARGSGQARSVVFVLNPADPSVGNSVSRALAKRWRRQGGNITVVELPAAWKAPHDFVDSAQPGAQVSHVYPLLLSALLESPP